MQNKPLKWTPLSSDPLEKLADVADALDVSRDSLRRWIRKGRLQAIRLGGRRGFYRIRRSRVLALLGDEDTNNG